MKMSNYVPDFSSSDDDSFTDDGDYYEFKQKLREIQKERLINYQNEQRDKEVTKSERIFQGIQYGKTDEVLQEIETDFEIDTNLKNGWTALLYASSMGNPRIVRALLEKGANIDSSIDNQSALILACSCYDQLTSASRLETIEILIKNGAKIDSFDRFRRTAIMFAAFNGNLDAVRILLPLTNQHTVDNQRWNVLFWAVDGNQPEIVSYLLSQGFDVSKKDVRGQTVIDIAQFSGFYKILDLFRNCPIEDLQMYRNDLRFEANFEDLSGNDRPRFIADICRTLYSVRNENLMSLFYGTKNVTLYDFFALCDEDLKKIGVQLPYQRKRIIQGLYKFHKCPFRPESIPVVGKKEIYSNIDTSFALLSAIKQMLMMEASIKFIMHHLDKDLVPKIGEESKEICDTLDRILTSVNRMDFVVEQLSKKIELWDASLKPADLITTKRQNIPWCTLFLVLTTVPFCIYHFIRKF